MKTLKITFVLLVSFLFMGCPQSDDDNPIIAPTMNLRIENTGVDTIETLKVETVAQTITLNQLIVNTPTDYYLISNLNANSVLNVTFENSTGTSITYPLVFGDIGNYKLDVGATSDFSDTSTYINQE